MPEDIGQLVLSWCFKINIHSFPLPPFSLLSFLLTLYCLPSCILLSAPPLKSMLLPENAMLFLVLSWLRISLNLSQYGKVFLILQISMTGLASPKSFPYCSPNGTPPTAGSGLPLCLPSVLCVFTIVPTYLFAYLNSS